MMRTLLLYFFLIPFFSISQTINSIDAYGNKQGVWSQHYPNGNIRYKGQFEDNIPQGLFFYYYESGELQAEKEFFHKGKAVATHFFYKDGTLKSSGLYVEELKDSTWNYYSRDSILVMSEQYKGGKLNGTSKSFYYDGSLYEIKSWKNVGGNLSYFCLGPKTQIVWTDNKSTLLSKGSGKNKHQLRVHQMFLSGSRSQ